MNTKQAVGIILFAMGGTLFLDSFGIIMRSAFVVSENMDWFSLGAFTGFISLVLVGFGIYLIFEPALVNTH